MQVQDDDKDDEEDKEREESNRLPEPVWDFPLLTAP